MGRVCGTNGIEKRCKEGFGGEPEGRLRWEGNVTMSVKGVIWKGCGLN
jgi:hypothetical protein